MTSTRRSPRADLRMAASDWRETILFERDDAYTAPTVQREPTWLVMYGLGMMTFGVIAGVALTLFVAGVL